jgi:hypothetical protein
MKKYFYLLLIKSFFCFNKNISSGELKKNKLEKIKTSIKSKLEKIKKDNEILIITLGSIFGTMILSGIAGLLVRNKNNNGSYFNFQNWYKNKK